MLRATLPALAVIGVLAGCGGNAKTASTPQRDTPQQGAAWVMKTRPGALPALCTFVANEGTRLADVEFANDYNATPYGQSATAPSADQVFLVLVRRC